MGNDIEMIPEEIAHQEFINSFDDVGEIVLDGQWYAVIMRPDDDPNVPQFHLHPFSDDRYDYYDNTENDICISLNEPRYIDSNNNGRLSTNAKKVLNEFMLIGTFRGTYDKWSLLAAAWYWWYNIATDCKESPDYNLLP